jgi:hypothetical protein
MKRNCSKRQHHKSVGNFSKRCIKHILSEWLEGAVIGNNAATSSIPNTHVLRKRQVFIVARSKVPNNQGRNLRRMV